MRIGNNPLGEAIEEIYEKTFKKHPYRTLPIGKDEHINAYNFKKTYNHYKKWYVPNNAVLIVSGRTTIEEVKKFAQKYFGKLKPIELPKRIRIKEPYNEKTETIHKEVKRVKSYIYKRNYQSPNHNQSSANVHKKHAKPLLLLAHYLGYNTKSIMYKEIVREKKLALSLHCSQSYSTRDPSHGFTISAKISKDQSFEKVSNEIDSIIKKVTTEKIPQKDIDRCINEVELMGMYDADGNNKISSILTSYLNGVSLDEINNWPDALKEIKPNDLLEAAKAVFSQKPVVDVRISPKS